MPTSEEVPDEPRVEPNIAQIAKLIDVRGPVHRAEEKAQDGRADLGNLYQRIQNDYHGHRGAVKMVRKLLTGTPEACADFMRTFEPLCEHFNLFPSQKDGDLVDQAERGAGGETKHPSATALENARAHLSGGTKPEPEAAADAGGDGAGAPGGPQPEPEVAKKATGKATGKGRAKLSIVDPAPAGAEGTKH